MRGEYSKILAAAAIATLTGLAQAQLVFLQPVVNNMEIVGPRTTITLSIPAGENSTGRLLTSEDISVEARIVDSNMNVLAGPFATTVINGPYAYWNIPIEVEASLAGINFAGTLVPGNRVLMTVRTAGSWGVQNPIGGIGTEIVGLSAVFNANEAIDTVADIDNAGPVLQNVFVSGGFIYFMFNESLVGSPGNFPFGNNGNHTVIASVDASDFEVSTSNSFVGNVTPTGLTAATVIGVNNSVIRFARDANTTNTTIGSFIRPAYADNNVTPSPALSIFDVVSNYATPHSAQISTPDAFAVTSVEWINTVDEFTDNQVDRLRVVFNYPLQTTGNTSFYNRLRVDRNTNQPGLENSRITVDLVTPDPENPNAVLLRVDAENEGVSADGLRTASNGDISTGQYTLSLDSTMGNTPRDLFSRNFSGTANVLVGDKIEPSPVLTAIGDTNPRDGHADTVYIVFDEPIADITSNTGFKVVRQGAAVNPIQLINQETGQLGMATTVVDGGPANNNLPNLMVSRASIDVDNDGTLDPRETGNAVCIAYNALTFDWDNDGLVGLVNDPDEAIPGTGNLGAVQVQYAIATGTIVDVNGNTFDSGGFDFASLTNADRAAPFLALARFIAGENTSDDQIAFYFGENLASAVNSDDESRFRFGPGGVYGFQDDPDVSSDVSSKGNNSYVSQSPANVLNLRNAGSDPNLVQGVSVSILPGSGYTDAAGNEVTASDTVTIPPPACMGDANDDGIVNFADITSILFYFNTSYSPGTGLGDGDQNGVVNFSDITTTLLHWNTNCD